VGHAVARQGSAELARALDLTSQIFHRDGLFIDIGRLHSIRLASSRRSRSCGDRRSATPMPAPPTPGACWPPLDAALKPTSFAGDVTGVRAMGRDRTGVDVTLPMLKTAPAWSLFKDGVAYSLILIAGALAATLAFAIVLGAPWARG